MKQSHHYRWDNNHDGKFGFSEHINNIVLYALVYTRLFRQGYNCLTLSSKISIFVRRYLCEKYAQGTN